MVNPDSGGMHHRDSYPSQVVFFRFIEEQITLWFKDASEDGGSFNFGLFFIVTQKQGFTLALAETTK